MNTISSERLNSLALLALKVQFGDIMRFRFLEHDTIICYRSGSRFSLISINENSFTRNLLSDTGVDSKRQISLSKGTYIAGECMEFDSFTEILLLSDISDMEDSEVNIDKIAPIYSDLSGIKEKFPNQKGIISRFE